MALNEEKILSDKFIFISYSHKDSEAVKEDMEALISRGVRAWFDENMRLGDDWTEIAARVINHENCAGVLFYNSANSFLSSAVQKEQMLTKERADAAGLKYWSVNLAEKDFDTIYDEAYDRGRKSYLSIMTKQNEMFNNNILCILRRDSASAVEAICAEIAVPYRLIDNEDNFMSDIQKMNIAFKDTNEIAFGSYIDREYIGPEHAVGSEDQRFGFANHLIQLNEKRYATKVLYWRLLYVEDGKAVLLCNRILTQCTYNDGEDFLKNVFAKIAFSDEEKEKLGSVTPRFMKEEDAVKCRNVHYEASLSLSEDSKLAHWWINENGLTENWKQTYSRDYHYEKGFSIFVKKGLRPVIEIPSKIFKSIKEK